MVYTLRADFIVKKIYVRKWRLHPGHDAGKDQHIVLIEALPSQLQSHVSEGLVALKKPSDVLLVRRSSILQMEMRQ